MHTSCMIYKLQTLCGNVLGMCLNFFFLNIKQESTNGTGRGKLLREKIIEGLARKEFYSSAIRPIRQSMILQILPDLPALIFI